MTAPPPATPLPLEAAGQFPGLPGLRGRIILAYVAKHNEPPPMAVAFANFIAEGIEGAGPEGSMAQRQTADVQAALLGVTWRWLLGLASDGSRLTEVEARVDIMWWAWRIQRGKAEDVPGTAELAKRWGWTLEEVEQASKRWVREEGRG